MIRILAIVAMLATLASCKKCADCTTTVTIKTGGNQPQTSESTQEMCGDDLKEADGHTTTSTATVGFVTSTITSKTECD